MKRKGNLYPAIYDFDNIINAYNEVCRNTKNKRKVLVLKEYKSVYVSRIYNILKKKNYVVGSYNKFVIYEPKKRLIVSQNVQDKIINHLVARHILYPAILPCLLDVNVASRKNKGTKQGLLFMNSFMHKCKIRYSHFYILKCDISKFFSSINHEILKKKLLKEKGEISTKENLREQDVLLATGEQITIAKLSMCLSDLGYKAISLLGWQVPIITDSNYGDANVIDIKTDRILKELKEEKIVIIAGFQGVTRDNNITTLGRRRL